MNAGHWSLTTHENDYCSDLFSSRFIQTHYVFYHDTSPFFTTIWGICFAKHLKQIKVNSRRNWSPEKRRHFFPQGECWRLLGYLKDYLVFETLEFSRMTSQTWCQWWHWNLSTGKLCLWWFQEIVDLYPPSPRPKKNMQIVDSIWLIFVNWVETGNHLLLAEAYPDAVPQDLARSLRCVSFLSEYLNVLVSSIPIGSSKYGSSIHLVSCSFNYMDPMGFNKCSFLCPRCSHDCLSHTHIVQG